MVFEGLAALSLAANILQFAEFASKIISKSQKIYESTSGFTDEDAGLLDITKSLDELTTGLYTLPPVPDRSKAYSPDEKQLQTLAKSCRDAADKLTKALEKLKVEGAGQEGSRRKWKSLRQALTRLWKAKEIDEMAENLDSCRQQVTFCLLKILK